MNTTLTVATPACQGGGPVTLSLPLTVSVVWSGAPVATLRDTAQFNCLNYRNEGQSLSVTNLANVTASLAPLPSAPLTSDQGSLASGTTHVHAEGVQQFTCHL